jgi:hypothetical protein
MLIARLENRESSHERCKNASAVNIANDDGGYIGGNRETEIRDVAVAKIDLGGTARSLTDHYVKATAQLGVRLDHKLEQAVFMVPSDRRVQLTCGMAENDQLTTRVSAGL